MSEKGQVTIPKPLRIRLGLEPGQVLQFREWKGRLLAEKLPAQDSVASVYGIIRLDSGTDGVMRKLRGGAGHS